MKANQQAVHDKKTAVNEAAKALQQVDAQSNTPAATKDDPKPETKPDVKPETVVTEAPKAAKTLTPISMDDLREHITSLTSFDLRNLADFIRTTQAGRQVAEAQAAREQIAAIAANLGMSVQELVGGVKGAKEKKQGTLPGVPVPAKFRHPETGATWSGRGRRPQWVTDWIATHGSDTGIAV